MINLIIGISSILTLMLQFGIINRLPLLSGTADLLIVFVAAWSLQDYVKHYWIFTLSIGVFVSLISAMPFFTPLISYLAVYLLAQLIKKRLWQVPLLAMFSIVFLGTLIQHLIYMFVLQVSGVILNWAEGFSNTALPSLLINIALVIPVFAIVQELAVIFTPKGQEV